MLDVESCIEILAGLSDSNVKVTLENSDHNLIRSLGRQVFRGIPFTDRQYELAKSKIIYYDQQLKDKVRYDLSLLRMPLRKIDRTKSISYDESDNTIKVRFTFNKKLIDLIDNLRTSDLNGTYEKQNKTHSFPYNEYNLYKIVKLFEGRNFVLDSFVEENYKIMDDMMSNKKDYIPGIYGFKIKNLNDKAVNFMISALGSPDSKTLPLYKDRSKQFGIEHIDDDDLQESINQFSIISKGIINRQDKTVFVDKGKYNFNNLAESLLELSRYPILVVLSSDDPLGQMLEVHKSFSGVFYNDSSTVMFREDNLNEYNQNFNQSIKDYGLNNSLDSNTKIVYINANKLPKPLLQSDWRPQVALFMKSVRCHRNVETYLDELDLQIHYDTDLSPFVSRFHKVTKI